MRMQKKSQIAVFIIIGVLIIIFFLFITNYRQVSAPKGQVSVIDTAPVQSFVSACLKKTGDEAITYIGQHGGFYELPAGSDELFKMPFYLKNEQLSWPSRTDVERELGNYVDTELRFCLKNFVDFKGLAFDFEVPVSNVTIYDKKVVFATNFPINIKQNDATATIDKFNEEVDSKIGTIINVVDSYMQFQSNDTKTICLSCLLGLINENNLSLNLGNVENNTLIFTITDKEIPVENDEYNYQFLMQYNFEEE